MSERYSAGLVTQLRDTMFVAESTRRSIQGNRSTGIQPDIVLPKAKLAIFVHGCYWHQCPHCQRNRTPKTNAAYWSAKFQANQDRDDRNQADLQALGYRVLVFWECEIKADLEVRVEAVRKWVNG